MTAYSKFYKLAYDIASNYGYDNKECPTFNQLDDDQRKQLCAAKLAEYREASDLFADSFETITEGLSKMGNWKRYDDYRQNCVDTMESILTKLTYSNFMQNTIDDVLVDAYDHYMAWNKDNDHDIKRAVFAGHSHI